MIVHINPPARAADVTFAATTDVVIVGLGAAGASAALEARAAGADVLVLERASGGGGSTAYAGGYIYLGGGTRLQMASGHQDSVEAMHDYLLVTTMRPDHGKLAAYCRGSVAHFEWLVAQGVPFNEEFYGEKHFEHPTEASLAWSGNEKLWPYREIARPSPRGHRAAAPAGTGGRVLMDALIARAEAAGVALQYDSAVDALVVDEAGCVCGVRVRRFGEAHHIAARGGVVLATGGYGMNPALLERFCPALGGEGIEIIGSPNSDGAGLELGLSAGGAVENISAFFATCPIYPPAKLLQGVLVNRNGQRFVAEDAYHGRTTAAILRQPRQQAWLICDVESFDRPVMGQPLVDAWENVEDMERDLAMPRGSLMATLERYNEDARAGHDPLFHKAPEWLRPIMEPPLAAIDCSVGAAPFLGFSLGGLATDADGRVLDAHREPISGLYAAGATAANIAAAQDLEGYASGTCIGESTFFGRCAGRHAALARLSAEMAP